MGHIGVLLLRGGAHALAMVCTVPCEGFGIPPMVVRRPQGLRRLALAPILRTASKLCLLCIVLGVRRILLGLLLGRFLGSGSILPGSGDAPAQGPEAGRGLPLHVAYPGGLRGRGERPRREGPRVYRVGREREERAHGPPGPLARQGMTPIGYPRVPSHHSPLPPQRRQGKQDRYQGTPRDGRWDAPPGATSPHHRTPPRRPAVSSSPTRPGRGWARPGPTVPPPRRTPSGRWRHLRRRPPSR